MVQGPNDGTSAQPATTGNPSASGAAPQDAPAQGTGPGMASDMPGSASPMQSNPPTAAMPAPATAQTASAPTTLSDPEIAQIANVANEGEIEQGRYAASHAKTAAVKRFAQHMVSAHTDIGQKMAALVKRQSITPTGSADSMHVHAVARKALEAMKSATGSDVDQTYMTAEVAAHQDLLDALDGKLIPNAQNAELKATLQRIRPMVAEHLKEASDVLASSQSH
jgi:putative membrane protein